MHRNDSKITDQNDDDYALGSNKQLGW